MSEEQTIEKKKPGRPARQRSAAGLSVDEAHRTGIVMGDERDSNTAVVQERVRVPLNSGQQQSLRGYTLDWANFHYYWFHESAGRGGRINEALEAFYEHCQLNGENIKTPAGSGWDYLMRLPIKYYREDVKRARDQREALAKQQDKLKGDDKLQEYGVDRYGKPIFEGEAPAHQSSSDNPYA